VRLDRPPFCYRPPENAPAECGAAPVTRNGYVTFGCLSRTVRYNERVVATWARLLHAVPDTRLRLDNKPFEDAETVALFRERFAEHGIGPERLVFACSRPHWQAFMRSISPSIPSRTTPEPPPSRHSGWGCRYCR